MTLDFSKLRDVVFFADTIEFRVVDANFSYNCDPVEFDKATQYVRRIDNHEPIMYVEDPASVFGRANWRTYVSPGAVDSKPTKENGFLTTRGVVRPGTGGDCMKDTITLICATDEFIDFMDSDPGSPCNDRKLTLVKDTRELYREGTDGALCTLPEETIEGLFGPEWKALRTELPREPKKDLVDRPAHYSRYGIETIDALKGTMSPEEFNGFLKGNAFKYLTRAGAKDSLEQDLHKVCWYAMFLYLHNGGSVESLGKTYKYMKGRFAK